MKKFFIIATAIIIAACESASEKEMKQTMNDLQNYLDMKMPGAIVMEIVQKDSAYSAYSDLLALRLSRLDYYKDLSDGYKEMCNASSYKNYIEKKKLALEKIINYDEDGYHATINEITKKMSDPFAEDVIKNGIGVYARIRLDDGKETDEYFFYEAEKDVIEHSSDDVFRTLNSIFDDNKRIRDLQDIIMDDTYL